MFNIFLLPISVSCTYYFLLIWHGDRMSSKGNTSGSDNGCQFSTSFTSFTFIPVSVFHRSSDSRAAEGKTSRETTIREDG
mgnify:CR=1 FL=1